MIQVYFITDRHKLDNLLFSVSEQELEIINNLAKGVLPYIDPYGDTILYTDHVLFICNKIQVMVEDKERQFCYDRHYHILKELYDKLKSIAPKKTDLFLVGD